MTFQISSVHSRQVPEMLLHRIIRPTDAAANDFARVNVCNYDDRLQLALLSLPAGKTFMPHIHVEVDDPIPRGRAQESWVVVRGLVEATYFDVDGSVLERAELCPGDLSFTFAGGHTYLALDGGTLVYEFKSGPYWGNQYDKASIVGSSVRLEPGQRIVNG